MSSTSFPIRGLRRRASVVALGIVAVANGPCGCAANAADEGVGEVRQAFKNQYNGNAIHEEITVEALSFLRPDDRNYLALTNEL